MKDAIFVSCANRWEVFSVAEVCKLHVRVIALVNTQQLELLLGGLAELEPNFVAPLSSICLTYM